MAFLRAARAPRLRRSGLQMPPERLQIVPAVWRLLAMQSRPRAAATPIAFVKAIMLAYEKYGFDPRWVLAQAQIPLSLLGQSGARITAEQMETVSSLAMQQLD